MTVTAADVALAASSIAWLTLPGLGVLIAGRARGWTLAASPLVTYGLVGIVSPLTSVLGIRWSPWTFATAAVVAVIIAFALGRRGHAARRSGPPDDDARTLVWWRRPDALVLLAVLVGAAIGAGVLLAAMNRIGAVNQDWDAIFHGNAIRAIVDTGDADPGALRIVNNEEADRFFYPNAFHALAAVVTETGGVGIDRVLGMQTLLVPGLASLALAAFARSSGLRVAVAACSAVLLSAFSSFPYDVLWRGPLLPYAFGLALVPVFLVLLRHALEDHALFDCAACATGAVGLLALQPSTAIVGAVYAVALLVSRWRSGARLRADLTATAVVAVAALVLGGRQLIGAARSAEGAGVDWPADLTPGHALGDLLFLNHSRPFPQWWLVIVVAVGLVTVRQLERVWWWLLASIPFALLFVAAAAYEGRWVAALTRPWWNDRWRLIAIVTVPGALLAGQGAAFLGARAASLVGREVGGARWRTPVLVGGPVAVLLIVGLMSGGLYASSNADRVAIQYGDGPTVSRAEADAFDRLAELADDGVRVLNDPRDGSAWMWSLADVRPVFGHVFGPLEYEAISEDRQALFERFNQIDTDPEIQRLVREYDIGYVFIGSGFVRPEWTHAAGLTGLEHVRSVELVEAVDGTAIYRVKGS